MLKKAWFQGLFLIIAATAIAIVANGFASPQRRLLLNAWYPDARKVPVASGRVDEVTSRPVETATMPATTATATIATATATATTTTPVTATTATTTTPLDDSKTRPPVTSTPAPVPAVAEKSAVERFAPHPDKAYVEISGEDVALLHGKGVLFLDARRTSVFEQGHIAGARSFSVWEADIDDKVNKLFEERSDPREQNQPIVIYCSGGACEDSHMLAQKLWGIQFNNVYVYKDGFPDWQNRNGAVRTGGQP